MKKWLIIASILLAGCSGDQEAEPISAAQTISIGGQTLVLEAEQLRPGNESEPDGLDILYEDTRYHYKAGNKSDVTVNVRKINNGDRFVMVRLQGEGSINGTISIQEANDYYFIDWTKNMPERIRDKEIGRDALRPPVGLFRYTNNGTFINELVMSHTFTSREVNKLYGNGGESRVRELLSEKNTSRHSTEGIQFTLEADRGEIAEQWFLLAEEPLFNQTAHLNSWITFQQNEYQRVNNWFTVDGALKKLPWSIEPSLQNGYGRKLDMMLDKEAINRYFKQKDRYFYNLTVQSAANLWTYRQSYEDRVWKTEYTSVPLKEKYALTAPYVDKRQNAFIVRYLNEIGEEFDVDELTKILPEYSDYLLNLIAIDNVLPMEKGYLPADFYVQGPSRRNMPASLRHALNEADLLMEAYRITGNKKYRDAVRGIRRGIESAGAGDGAVTVEDLKRHEFKWKSLGGKPSPAVQKIIESKEEYLNSK
ncbi:hypothetical protein BTO30_01615 [Domibacillus antri]|uniref:Lipoprotein n=1 Tax=Domibacillus antri TaxID=1714264 RepID=A0A1Q8Q9X5_9BACI|nr:hypothetical protein [Domibacillus antri]OLN24137.1 hypothetical protein BTO30_01615 [Domibacillus antri]